MTKHEWIATLSLPLFSGLLAAGCGGGGGGGGGAPPSTTTGEVQVRVTDAPPQDLNGVTVASITVEWVAISAVPSGTAAALSSGNAGNGNGNARGNGGGASSGGATTRTNNGNAYAYGRGNGLPPQANGQARGIAAPGSGSTAGVASNNGNGKGNTAPGATAANVNSNSPNGNGPINSQNPNLQVLFDSQAAGAPRIYNLLDLRGGISAELATAQIPAGSYDRLRMKISAAELVVNGQSFSSVNGGLQLAAGVTAGIDISLAGPAPLVVVAAGQPAQVLVDFDVAGCFQPTGNGGYVFTPKIRAADMSVSGSLAGAVRSDNLTPADPTDDLPLGNAAVTLTQGTTTFTTFADPTGVYVIQGLAEGAWDVKFSAPGHADSTVTAQPIVRQQQSTLDATLVKQ